MCIVCGKDFDVEFHSGHVLLNGDGDFACSKKCAEKHEKEKKWFFDVVVQSEETCLDYLSGTLNPPDF